MDTRRVILYAALALIVYSLWTSWHQDYPATPATAPQNQEITKQGQLLPDVVSDSSSESGNQDANPIHADSAVKQSDSRYITVKTDVLDIQIDMAQGDIVNASLLDYPVSVEEKDKPTTLLNNNPGERYVANSSLLVSTTKGVIPVELDLLTSKPAYQLENNQKTLTVVLEGKNNTLKVRKILEFTRGSYLIQVSYQISNEGQDDWQGYLNTQLLRDSPREDQSSIFHVGSYVGASYSVPGQHKYQKVTFKDMTKSSLNTDSTGGWVAMQQHYFLSAWVPQAESKNVIYTRAADNNYTIGVVSSPIHVKSGDNKTVGAQLYVGPEITHVLQNIAPGLDLTVDYGWLWFLSSALFAVMKTIHSVIGNWGWSIVLVTMLIKLAFYRLSASSYRSMAGMRQLQPKLQALRERYGDDKAKMSQATMELYRQEKVNPLGGCLPILVQIPVFIALYWVLLESVELRQAPFILWINDLAAADPYHILPIIMGGTMLIQQRLNPAPPDPMQAKIMMFLPVLFTILFWNFPSGLVLYWIVNNTLSILQQWHITRKYSDDKPNQKKLATAK